MATKVQKKRMKLRVSHTINVKERGAFRVQSFESIEAARVIGRSRPIDLTIEAGGGGIE